MTAHVTGAMPDGVGPVVEANDLGRAIAKAIAHAHRDAVVIDRDAYLRVLVPKRCAIERAAIEAILGRTISLPSDLEMVMTSFAGAVTITADAIVWERR